MGKYLTPDGQIKCPKCGQVQPVSEVCVSCDIYFKKYEVSLRRKEERKIKQRAMEKSEKAYIQADCNKEDIKKAVKEFLVLDEVLVAAFSWIFDPREHTFPYFKPGTLSKNYLLLTNKGNLVFWSPLVEKGHAIIPATSISEFKTKEKAFKNGGIYLYAKENLKASFIVLDLEKTKNYIGHFIKCGGDMRVEEAPQEPQEKEKVKDQVTLDSNTKLELEKTPDPQADQNAEDDIPGKRKPKAQKGKTKKEREAQEQKGSPVLGFIFLLLMGVLVYNLFSSETSKSTISGMPDSRYNQCIQLGKEVMDARDRAEGGGSRSARQSQKIWQRKFDQWARFCSLKALQNEGYDLNGVPISPLEWANLGR